MLQQNPAFTVSVHDGRIYRHGMARPQARYVLVSLIAGLAIATAACSSSSASDSSGTTAQQEPEIAPTFSVPTNDGGEFSFSEHIADDGRPIFLNLWASWCFPCREEMPAIDRSSQAFPEVAFIGVSVRDIRSDAEDFANEIGVTYLIAFDEQNAVDDAYKPLGLPASYIISADGIIVERIFGRVTEEDLAAKFDAHFGL
jgi:cytochrome c biogenesis protein CcmG/thiol:disulfide interchange protein DsbE